MLAFTIGVTLWSIASLPTRRTDCLTQILINNRGDRQYAETTTPIIIDQPRANYTSVARRYKVEGVVKLRVILNADGTVSGVRPLTTLPYGLTDEAIKAATRIEFLPAKVNNESASSEMLVEYYFYPEVNQFKSSQ